MSAFDDLFAAVVDDRRTHSDGRPRDEVGPLEALDLRRIGAAMDRARASEGKPVPEEFLLPDYVGAAARLRVDGEIVGSHGLTVVAGDTCYVADLAKDAPHPLHPLLLSRRRWFRSAAEERLAQADFGLERSTRHRAFDRRYVLRCNSEAQALTFLRDDIITALGDAHREFLSLSMTVEDRRLLLRVITRVDVPQEAASSIALARAAWVSACILAERPGGFAQAARAPKEEVTGDQIARLVERVRDATTFASGVVERVGAGIEAKLELDLPEGLKGSLRIEPKRDGESACFFSGALMSPPTKKTTLVAEKGAIRKARGRFDPKVGDALLDAAFLIDGNADDARVVLAERNAALRLVGRDATLTIDGAGLTVRVDPLPAEDTAMLEAIVACIALWREAARKNAGLNETTANVRD